MTAKYHLREGKSLACQQRQTKTAKSKPFYIVNPAFVKFIMFLIGNVWAVVYSVVLLDFIILYLCTGQDFTFYLKTSLNSVVSDLHSPWADLHQRNGRTREEDRQQQEGLASPYV